MIELSNTTTWKNLLSKFHPKKLPIQMQWWSNLLMHLSQRWQCFVLYGCIMLQTSQNLCSGILFFFVFLDGSTFLSLLDCGLLPLTFSSSSSLSFPGDGKLGLREESPVKDDKRDSRCSWALFSLKEDDSPDLLAWLIEFWSSIPWCSFLDIVSAYPGLFLHVKKK